MKLVGYAIRVHNSNVFQFSGTAVSIIRKHIIRKYGKSTKRITKKRMKNYLMDLLITESQRIINEKRS